MYVWPLAGGCRPIRLIWSRGWSPACANTAWPLASPPSWSGASWTMVSSSEPAVVSVPVAPPPPSSSSPPASRTTRTAAITRTASRPIATRAFERRGSPPPRPRRAARTRASGPSRPCPVGGALGVEPGQRGRDAAGGAAAAALGAARPGLRLGGERRAEPPGSGRKLVSGSFWSWRTASARPIGSAWPSRKSVRLTAGVGAADLGRALRARPRAWPGPRPAAADVLVALAPPSRSCSRDPVPRSERHPRPKA